MSRVRLQPRRLGKYDMDRQVPDELISAFFDGEASPDERSAVERLLAESEFARRELDETAQLSALLHSFPREAAPVDLAANVLRQTDKMPVAAPAATLAAPPQRSLRREWTAALLGAIVTAASLLLMVSVMSLNATRDRSIEVAQLDKARSDRKSEMANGRVADTPALVMGESEALQHTERRVSHMAKSSEGIRAMDDTTALKTSPLVAQQPVSRPPALEPPRSMERQSFSGSKAAAATAPSEPNNAVGLNRAMTLNVADNSMMSPYFSNSDFVSSLENGEVLTLVPQSTDPSNNVAVVDLLAVDVEKGVDQFQVLLADNRIQPRFVGTEAKREKSNSSSDRKQSGVGSNELVVVYSVGPGEQLAKTLKDISLHPDLFIGWSSQPPVQLPATNEELEEKVRESAKDASAAISDKEKTFRKERAAGTDAEDEAELALNALLVRNTYFNDADAIANNADVGGVNVGKRAGSKLAAQPANNPSTLTQRPAAPKSGAVAGDAVVADNATKKQADNKRDAANVDAENSQRFYQRTLRIPTEANQQLSEPLNLNTRTAGLNLNLGNNGLQQRRMNFGNGSQTSQQLAANPRADANRAVKVLFVLHPAQAPAAAAPIPSGKAQ